MQGIRVATKVLFENMLMEMFNPAQIRITPEEAYDYAVSAGAKFVRLRYKGSVPCHIMGFQSGILTIMKGQQGVRLGWAGKQEKDGTVCKTGRLYFKPDKLGILWGDVPKFPVNMKLLAAHHINDSREWEYTNEQDEREIAELAEGFVKNEGWVRDKIERKTSRSFRKVAQPTEAPKAIPEVLKVPRVEDVQAESTSTVLNAPVVARKPGRPRLKTEGLKNDNNAVGDVHKG